MELFHEYRNRCVRAFIELMERIVNGEEMTVAEFESEYYRISGDKKRITSVFYENVVFNIKRPVFDMSDKKKVKLCLEKVPKGNIHILNKTLKSENDWLYAAMNDRLSSLFLTEEYISEIRSKLSDCNDYYRYIDDMWRKDETITDENAEIFQIVLDAINEKKTSQKKALLLDIKFLKKEQGLLFHFFQKQAQFLK